MEYVQYNKTMYNITEKGSEKSEEQKEDKTNNIKNVEAEVGSEKEGKTLLCILL